ncbi:RpiB/LacA/LacB family sugar-phosphate isomerase [Candidatus Pacearchaeota archaeon]|nr:RpiB/LacA/LacB family sugar-phosphate isomerase [Candidatus Pacearchaeota archaeon]
MRIYLGSDHAGFILKQKIKAFLDKKKILYEDLGSIGYNKDDDYPDFVLPVARKVAKDKQALGIVFGGSGQGEAITANKIKGIRAVVYYGGSLKIIKLSKKHNNANVLSLGARFLNEKEAIKAIRKWLKTKFSDKEKHKRRLKKINKLGSR